MYNIKGDLGVLRRVSSRFMKIESLSGNTGNVLSADNNGDLISKDVDFFLTGSTLFNGKVNNSTFYPYTSNTNTLIGTKLNTSTFNTYTSNTSTLLLKAGGSNRQVQYNNNGVLSGDTNFLYVNTYGSQSYNMYKPLSVFGDLSIYSNGSTVPFSVVDSVNNAGMYYEMNKHQLSMYQPQDGSPGGYYNIKLRGYGNEDSGGIWLRNEMYGSSAGIGIKFSNVGSEGSNHDVFQIYQGSQISNYDPDTTIISNYGDGNMRFVSINNKPFTFGDDLFGLSTYFNINDSPTVRISTKGIGSTSDTYSLWSTNSNSETIMSLDDGGSLFVKTKIISPNINNNYNQFTAFTQTFYQYTSATNTLINTKLNITDFNSYSSNTNTLIGSKLNITDFNSYSSNTNTLIGTKLNTSTFNTYSSNTNTLINTNYSQFTAFTNSFNSYSSNTNTLINTKLNITDFNSYSSNTNTLINTKLNITDFNSYSSNTLTNINTNYSQFTGFTNGFYQYTSDTNTLIGSKYDKSGGTITGSVIISGSISASTYQNLPLNIIITGGSYSNGTTTLINNTGGTININGFLTGGTIPNLTTTLQTIRDSLNTANPLQLSTERVKLNALTPVSAVQALLSLGTSDIASGSASGTYLGINTNTGYVGDLVNLQVNGSSKFKLNYQGVLTAGSHLNTSGDVSLTSSLAQLKLGTLASKVASDGVDGRVRMMNNAETGFDRLIFGTLTSPAIRLNSGILEVVSGTSNTLSSFSVGGFSASYVAKSGTYTITANDHTIDCTSNTFTVTLPTSVGISGKIYNIKNSGTGIITIATTSSQTIDGSLTKMLVTQYSGCNVQSNGANWIMIGTF